MSNLRKYDRFDHFHQPRVEPTRYPETISSWYKVHYRGEQNSPQVVEGDNRRHTDPITGVSRAKMPSMDMVTTNRKELDRKRIDPRDMFKYENTNKVDHLAREHEKEDLAWRKSTEYRDSSNMQREIVQGAGAGRTKYKERPKVEKETVYSKDFTHKQKEKGFIDSRKIYKDNIELVRSYFSANNIGVGKGFVHPLKDSSTYKQSYRDLRENKRDGGVVAEGRSVRSGAVSGRVEKTKERSDFGRIKKMGPLNYWGSARMEQKTQYQHEFVNHVPQQTTVQLGWGP